MNDKVHFRMCIGCREMLHKSLLFRICLKEGAVFADVTGKAGGRGAYVCSADCMHKAEKNKRLNKVMRRALSDAETAKLLEELVKWNKTKN